MKQEKNKIFRYLKFKEDIFGYKQNEIYTTHQQGIIEGVKGILSFDDFEQLIEYKHAEEIKMTSEEKSISNQKIDQRTLFRLNIAQDLTIPYKRRDVTEALANDFLDHNFVFTTENDDKPEIWIYSEGIYVPNGKMIIYQYVRDITNRAYTTNLANEVVSKIMADTCINQEDFYNANYPDLIPVQNGILNIHTKELKEFSPKYIFFGKLPVSYNPQASCPVIQAFFKSIQPDDKRKRDFLIELAGYCLYKKYTIQKWFLFEGKGRNGKGAYFRLIQRLLGDNTSNISIQDLEEKEYSISDLHGKYANIGGDIPSRPLKNTSRIKALTGEDKVSVNRKFKSYLSFYNYSKQIFSANELPEVIDFSDGFWERLVYLYFPVKYIDQDDYDNLKEKSVYVQPKSDIEERMNTEEELSGFLNMCLDSLKVLLKKKKFSYSLGVDTIKSMYLRNSDNVVAFVQDCCVKDYKEFIKKDDFREEYNKYCDENNIVPKSDKAIKHTMQEKLGIVEKRPTLPVESFDESSQQKFERILVWKGIRLKNELEKAEDALQKAGL